MLRVGPGVDANPVAQRAAAGTAACALVAGLAASADFAARAAVRIVDLDVDAGASTHDLLSRAADVGTRTVDTRLTCRANDAALAAMAKAGLGVDANAVAQRRSRVAAACAGRTDQTGVARFAALAAVARIALQIDAGGAALVQPSAARDSAFARVTDFVQRAGSRAITAMGWAGRGVDASPAAAFGAGRAHAARVAAAQLARVAGGIARAAMTRIAARIHAACSALGQIGAAAERTHTQIAELSGVAGDFARAAMRRVCVQVGAHAATIDLIEGASAATRAAGLVRTRAAAAGSGGPTVPAAGHRSRASHASVAGGIGNPRAIGRAASASNLQQGQHGQQGTGGDEAGRS